MKIANLQTGRKFEFKGNQLRQQIAELIQHIRILTQQYEQIVRKGQSQSQQTKLQRQEIQMIAYDYHSNIYRKQRRLECLQQLAKQSQTVLFQQPIHFQEQRRQEGESNLKQIKQMRQKIIELEQKLRQKEENQLSLRQILDKNQQTQLLLRLHIKQQEQGQISIKYILKQNQKIQISLREELAKKQIQNTCLKQQKVLNQNRKLQIRRLQVKLNLFQKQLQKEKTKNKHLEQKYENLQRMKIQQEKHEKRKKQIKKMKQKIISITPDTTTYAWKENQYRQDNSNNKVCIYQGVLYASQWLCSAQELDFDGECVFTIKAVKISKGMRQGIQYSRIQIGVMESGWKGQRWEDTLQHCVYLNLYSQTIRRPNQEQTGYEGIDCFCQPALASIPCLIECHVSRQQSTITWFYNGKEQAKSNIPLSWKDGRHLCAIVYINHPNDCVEFL